jgi:putative sterol carrier protein
MALDEIRQAIQDKLSYAPQLGAHYVFDFGDEGQLALDATQSPAELSADTVEEAQADAILRCDAETFLGFLDGSQDPNVAYMTGKLKIEGSLGYAMKLNNVLEE